MATAGRRSYLNSYLDRERAVDMREQFGSPLKILDTYPGGNTCGVDLQDCDRLRVPGVQEGADALNLISERTVDEADLVERLPPGGHAVLADALGGLPISRQRDVEDVLRLSDRHRTRMASSLHQRSERALAGWRPSGKPPSLGRDRRPLTVTVVATSADP